MRRLRTAAVALVAGAIALASADSRAAERRQPSGTLRLGISSTLFQGMPESIVIALMKPFEGLLIEQTGMGGELLPSGDGNGVAQALMEGKLDVGVLEGIEYAWLRQKHPELKPLMITINQEKCLHACVVVRNGGEAKTFADLKGKPVELFRNCREHCRLFLKYLCRKAGQYADQYFAKVEQSDNAEAVLDDVIDGKVACAVADNLSLECFRRRKPARFKQLVVVEKSPPFPASVVVYREGALDEATQRKFQRGMLNANKSVLGKQMLTLWKLTAFELVPDDYEETLTNIVKTFPAPAKESSARAD